MEIVIRAVAVYAILWVVLRAMGKRELAEMTAFELVILVVLGDIIQQGVTQEDMSVTGATVAVGTMTLWAVGGAWVAQRWRPAAHLLSGEPVVVVLDGEPLEDSLEAEAIDLDDVKEAAREKGIADLRDVAVAVLNPDGKLAFVERR